MKLIAFYFTYYAFLFVIFKTSIYVSKTTLPGNTGLDEQRGFVAPKTQKMLHSPAMNIFPISQLIEEKNSAENLIDLSKIKSRDGEHYQLALTRFFNDYKRKLDFAKKSENAEKYNDDCKAGNPDGKICVPYDQDKIDEIKKFCHGDDQNGYGYDVEDRDHFEKPCFLANINKIVNWKMQGLPNTNQPYLNAATSLSTTKYDSTFDREMPHLNISYLGALYDNERPSGYFGCYAFKMEAVPNQPEKHTVKWDQTINDTRIIEWSGTSFIGDIITDSQNVPDNSVPAYFYPFRGNSIPIAYKETSSDAINPFKLTTSKIDKRDIDYNWLHPFRAFKVNLGKPNDRTARFGENTVGIHFECNFYCANCMSTVYSSDNGGRMVYPSTIRAANNQQSQISFKIKFK